MAKVIGITVQVNLKGGPEVTRVATDMATLDKVVKELTKDFKSTNLADPGFEKKGQQVRALTTLLTQLKKGQVDVKTAVDEANAALSGQAPVKAQGYYRTLQAELTKTRNAFKDLTEAEAKSAQGLALGGRVNTLNSELKRLDATMGIHNRNVGNYKTALTGLGDALTGGLVTGGILALVSAGKQIVDINAKVSDSIADVAKTANVSIEFVNGLSDALEKRDTRTSLIDQLGIAKIGGQLGVAKEDLFGFVEAVDKVGVALGDQFGGSVEQTTDVIGKLRNVFKDIKTDDIGADILHIGNALNYLEAQGVASAGSIADFAGRIGGVGNALGVSAPQIFGVSTALAELNVNAERGSSGFVRLLQKVGSAPGAFAKAIDVPAKDFKKLVNDDIFGAVELFLQKVNDKKLSNTELSSLLKDLKINGVGTAEVVTKLGQNIQLLDQRVGEAGITLQQTGSIEQEFEKKNNTLGAEIEKLGNTLKNVATDNTFGDFLKGIVKSIDFAIKSPNFPTIFNLLDKLKKDAASAGDFLARFDPRFNAFKKSDKGQNIDKKEQAFTDQFAGISDSATSFANAFSLVFDDAAKSVDKTTDSVDDLADSVSGGGKGKKGKERSAAGSVAFFTEQVSKLKKELEGIPSTQVDRLAKTTLRLVQAEKDLKTAQLAIETERLKAEGNFDTRKTGFDRATNTFKPDPQSASGVSVELPVKIDAEANKAQNEADLNKLADELGKSVGVEISVLPSKEQQDAAQSIFDDEYQAAKRNEELRLKGIEDRAKKEKDTQKEIEQFVIDSVGKANQAIAQIETARVDAQLQKNLSALDAEYAAKIAGAQGNNTIIANLEKQLQAEKIKAEKDAAKKRQQIAIKEATIQYFLNLIKAGFNPVAIASVTVEYALALAAISAQSFHKGGTVKEQESGIVKGANIPAQKGGDNKLVFAKTGERFLTVGDQRKAEEILGADIWAKIGTKDPAPISRMMNMSAVPVPAFSSHQSTKVINTGMSDEQMKRFAQVNAAANYESTYEATMRAYEEGYKRARREEKVHNKINGR